MVDKIVRHVRKLNDHEEYKQVKIRKDLRKENRELLKTAAERKTSKVFPYKVVVCKA